jgi:hypothetical protein
MNQSPGEISLQFTVAINFQRVQLVHLSLVVASVAVSGGPLSDAIFFSGSFILAKRILSRNFSSLIL